MNKTVRNVLYVLIIIICVIAIFVGVYAQFFKREVDNEIGYEVPSGNGQTNVVTQAEIKDGFKDLFTNEFFDFNYDDTGIQKIDATKPIVFSGIDKFERKEEGKYDIRATIPSVNISGEVAKSYNDITNSIFIKKLNDIMTNTTLYTICDVSYTAYINNDILSVGIMASIKEGDSAQRLLVQTYNYNLKTDTNVTIKDVLQVRGLEEKVVNDRIKSVVKKAAEDAQSMQSTGYNVYERNLDSEIYEIDNVTNFMQGPNGELYIIYAYGNEAFTSEMDIIEI